MAKTVVPIELSSTPGIVDNSNATAITIDSSEDVTLAGHIVLADSKNVKLGAGTDLQLYHDGTNSYITNSTGALKVATESSGIAVTIGHTTSEVTIGDNLTVTGTLTLGSGAELTEAELEMLDGITAGTVAASKAVVVDSNKDAGSFRNITLTGELDAGSLDVSGDADIDGTLEADAITVDGTTLAEYISDTTGAMFSSNTETGITATYQDSDNTIDLVVGTLNQETTGTAAKVTVTDSTANTNFPVVFHDESNALLDDTGALRYNPSTGTLLVPNLSVAGTTTTVDTVTMEAQNAIIFEGATADGNETTLSIVDPTADHTQYLINQGGYIPVLAAATTTAITSTPAELNLLDGSTANTVVNSKAVVYGSSGELAGTLSTAAQTNITSVGTLTALTVDDISIDGSIITDSGGLGIVCGEILTFDVTSTIILDSDSGEIVFKDGGTTIAKFTNSSSDFVITSDVDDKDIIFKGQDSTSEITALTLDMSAAGAATFNDKIIATELDISGNVDIDGTLETDNLTVGGAQGSDGQVLTSTGSGVAWEDASGGLATSGGTLTGDLAFGDDLKIKMGASTGDLELYHIGGSVSVLRAQPALVLQSDDYISLGTYSDGELKLKATKNGAVDVYYDNTVKLSTTSGGVIIDGVANYNGLEVKGTGGSRPMIQWSNANNGDLCAIYGTEGNAMVLTSGSSNTAAMTIDSSQRVTTPGQPMFDAGRNAGYQTDDAYFVQDYARVNVGSHFDTSTGKFTAPIAGTYFFTFSIMTHDSGSVVQAVVQLRKNGSAAMNFLQHKTGAYHTRVTGNMILTLAANDYIQTYVGDSGTSSGWQGSAHEYNVFGGFLIG